MRCKQLFRAASVYFFVHLFASECLASEVTVEPCEGGMAVNIDGKLFTKYLTKSGNKPILWPIIGPTGAPMTRAYPLDLKAAKRDHIHHRSFWFAHGKVNGVDLWSEEPGSGSTRHKEFIKTNSGKAATIVTSNDWLDADGNKLPKMNVR
jgi:hypothetical protein